MRPGDLAPHPEGGHFREVYRSVNSVRAASGALRAALTHIYFGLDPGECSRFHRVTSDEVWNLYRGAVRLHLWDGAAVQSVDLSAAEDRFCTVVEAGIWQGAEPLEGSVLVGCSVAPGFDFADFEMIDPEGQVARQLLAAAPQLAHLVGMPRSG